MLQDTGELEPQLAVQVALVRPCPKIAAACARGGTAVFPETVPETLQRGGALSAKQGQEAKDTKNRNNAVLNPMPSFLTGFLPFHQLVTQNRL